MITTGYGICVVISVLLTLITALRNYEHIDSYDWSVMLVLPFLIFAYWIKALVSAPEAALLLIVIIELFTSMLLACVLFSTLQRTGIRMPMWFRVLVYGMVAVLLFPIWRLFNSEDGSVIIEISVSCMMPKT
jgi:hypothetical protein